MSERTRRLDELLREEISSIVSREIRDPRVGFVTVTDVEVTADLRHATVWVSMIGSDTERKASLRALTNSMPFVRRRLGELRLRRIPELQVKEDNSAVRGTRILRILEELEEGEEPAVLLPGETLPTPGPVHVPDEVADLVIPAVDPQAPGGTPNARRRPGRRERHAAAGKAGAGRPARKHSHGR